MKTFIILFLSLCLVTSTQAQAPVAPASAPLLTTDELDQLLGPIALYPDSLIALILPASTVPSDIVLASRYVSGNGDAAQIPNQPWDDSVKALTRYPDLLQWLDQNLDWTTQLGDTFLAQPADVMEAIQQLRAKATAAGTLVNTPQQQVVVDNGDISIQPADPNAIYVPQYDPDDVYDEGYSPDMGPLITFGPAWPVGEWLNYAFDWHRRGFYRGDWRRGGRGGFVGRDAGVTNASPWSPDPNRVRRAARTSQSAFRSVIRPKPLPGVTIPHGNRTGGNARTGTSPNAISGPGSPSNPTQRDFRGRGVNPPTGPAVQNKPLSPALVPHPPAPPPSILNDYRRGSDARAASNRGLTGRQPNVAPAIKPAPPAPNPAAPAPRPAPPAPRPAPPAPKPAPPAPKPAPPAPKPAPPAPRPAPPAPRPAPPAPRPAPPAPRPAPPAPRPAPPAPPPSAFHVAPAAAANAASARGAQSRDKRLPNQ